MKGQTFYSTKEYNFEGQVLLKPNMKVKIIEEVKSNYLFEGDSGGMLNKELFNKLFSPFYINQVVYHEFYGIGQITSSDKEESSAAVVFFSNPDHKYYLGDKGIAYSDIFA